MSWARDYLSPNMLITSNTNRRRAMLSIEILMMPKNDPLASKLLPSIMDEEVAMNTSEMSCIGESSIPGIRA
jgi:hypothetical protein